LELGVVIDDDDDDDDDDKMDKSPRLPTAAAAAATVRVERTAARTTDASELLLYCAGHAMHNDALCSLKERVLARAGNFTKRRLALRYCSPGCMVAWLLGCLVAWLPSDISSIIASLRTRSSTGVLLDSLTVCRSLLATRYSSVFAVIHPPSCICLPFDCRGTSK